MFKVPKEERNRIQERDLTHNVNIGSTFHQLAQVAEQFPGLAVMIFR